MDIIAIITSFLDLNWCMFFTRAIEIVFVSLFVAAAFCAVKSKNKLAYLLIIPTMHFLLLLLFILCVDFKSQILFIATMLFACIYCAFAYFSINKKPKNKSSGGKHEVE